MTLAKIAKAIRKENVVPAVVYGGDDKKAIHINVNAVDVRKLLTLQKSFCGFDR